MSGWDAKAREYSPRWKPSSPRPRSGQGISESLDEFKFFTENDESAEGGKELENLVKEPRRDTTLAQDVGSTPPPPRQTAPPPPRQTAPPPPRQSSPPPPPPRSTTTSTTRADGLIIQVLSTRDEARAKRILKQLQDGG